MVCSEASERDQCAISKLRILISTGGIGSGGGLFCGLVLSAGRPVTGMPGNVSSEAGLFSRLVASPTTPPTLFDRPIAFLGDSEELVIKINGCEVRWNSMKDKPSGILGATIWWRERLDGTNG